MDAMWVAIFVAVVGALVTGFVGNTPDSSGGNDVRAMRAITVGICTLITVFLVILVDHENDRGTLVPVLKTWYTGSEYVYTGSEGFRTSGNMLVVRLRDQDDEYAWYDVDCTNLYGGCDAVPLDGTSFSFISIGYGKFQVVIREYEETK